MKLTQSIGKKLFLSFVKNKKNEQNKEILHKSFDFKYEYIESFNLNANAHIDLLRKYTSLTLKKLKVNQIVEISINISKLNPSE